MPTPPAPNATGRAFAFVAFLEAATWAGLLVGMFLKYVTETTELGVQIFGWLHGVAFIVYVAVTLLAAVRLRWPLLVTVLALAASIPPLVTVVVEMWIRRRGLLTERTEPAARETSPTG